MKKLNIIYEDKEIIVVNKPSKLLTISDGNTDRTLYSMVSDYVKKQHKSNKIFIVHRLDKDTSGIVLFAKNEDTKHKLQHNWNSIVKREYIAILDGKLKTKNGVFKDYLFEDKNHLVRVSDKKTDMYSETEYELINYFSNYTVVLINIKTGKKNQIRTSFANIDKPILGDKKYGSKRNNLNRLGLHAYKLTLNYNDKEYIFESKIPEEFNKFIIKKGRKVLNGEEVYNKDKQVKKKKKDKKKKHH